MSEILFRCVTLDNFGMFEESPQLSTSGDRKCPAISYYPVQQTIVVSCDVTWRRLSVRKRHQEFIGYSFESLNESSELLSINLGRALKSRGPILANEWYLRVLAYMLFDLSCVTLHTPVLTFQFITTPISFGECGLRVNIFIMCRIRYLSLHLCTDISFISFKGSQYVTHLRQFILAAQTLAQLYIQHENQKKRQYLNRVLQVEKGSFSPLVFTTTGGMAPEAIRFLKRIAEKISAKTREKYSQVMNNIRTRISFEIMRSVLVAIRGVRGKIRQAKADPVSTIAFNLIPEARSYECP